MPEGRTYHVQASNYACGSRNSKTWKTCVKWSEGSWNTSGSDITLRERRYGHVSWASGAGVYLMGGIYSPMTSELVREDGTVEEGFPLEYKTEYEMNHIYY